MFFFSIFVAIPTSYVKRSVIKPHSSEIEKRIFCWLSASVPSQDAFNDVEIIKSPTWTAALS